MGKVAVTLAILRIVLGVLLLLLGLCAGLIWLLGLAEHGGSSADYLLMIVLFFASLGVAGIGALLIWRAVRTLRLVHPRSLETIP
jgi:hypothetical protein